MAHACPDRWLTPHRTGGSAASEYSKIHTELGWLPETRFQDGIKKTIKWYLENRPWWEEIISGEYQNYYEKMYNDR